MAYIQAFTRTFCEKLPKFPLFGSSLIHQLRLLGSQQHPQNGALLTSFSTWGTENSLAEINLESAGGVIKSCNIFLGQKLANTCSFVGGSTIVQQEKISRAERSWTNPLNAFQWALHYSFIKFYIYFFSPVVRILCALRLESRIKLSTWSWCGTFGISVSSAEGMSLEPIQNSVAFFWSQAKHQVSLVLIIQQDATSKWFILHLVTLYMFRVTIPPIIRGTIAVSANSGIRRLHVAISPTAFGVLLELAVLH